MKKEITVTELMEDVGDYKFDVNSWGSCQYSGALAMYNAYFKLRETHSKEKTLDYLKHMVDIDISFDYHNDKDHYAFSDRFTKYLKKKYDILVDTHWSEIEDEYDQRFFRNINRCQTVDDLFFACRASASDLWHTAPTIADICFKNLNIDISAKATGLERGPVGNIAVQSTNPSVGLCCALLVDYGFVKNSGSFGGFDT